MWMDCTLQNDTHICSGGWISFDWTFAQMRKVVLYIQFQLERRSWTKHIYTTNECKCTLLLTTTYKTKRTNELDIFLETIKILKWLNQPSQPTKPTDDTNHLIFRRYSDRHGEGTALLLANWHDIVMNFILFIWNGAMPPKNHRKIIQSSDKREAEWWKLPTSEIAAAIQPNKIEAIFQLVCHRCAHCSLH